MKWRTFRKGDGRERSLHNRSAIPEGGELRPPNQKDGGETVPGYRGMGLLSCQVRTAIPAPQGGNIRPDPQREMKELAGVRFHQPDCSSKMTER